MQWGLLLILLGQCCFMDCQLYQYLYINQNKNWTEAQQYCREKHTDLVTVTNMKDMERLISVSLGDIKEAWIGLYDQTKAEKTWHWSLPGVKFNESETNWAPNEPNNLPSEVQNCGVTWNSGSYYLKWGDYSCNGKQNFLCYNENDSSQKYHLINEAKNWTEAQSYCREKHTDLISGWKQLQDEEVKNKLHLMTANSENIFIGLFRDTWRWSDGSVSSFRHWNLQFNNQIINSGQCAMTVFDDGGRWRKENCDMKKPFICYEDKVILIKENKTWLEALTYCRGHHDDLVTITNMDDQILIQEKAKEASTPFVWLGLYFSCLKNKWFWVCKNNPNLERQINNCGKSGAMEAGGKHMWFQGNSTEKLNFFCLKR
ncbi:C-type mannose receptor 2-like [Gambusia affinis]|uniref:C-type mannose receptor 2-like n=1 Tax=Gambusia affinis TaxID=33528 RepID=UPI001CDBF1DD|nr:C-type mannose receptor 2-like [Gambusia affinis]